MTMSRPPAPRLIPRPTTTGGANTLRLRLWVIFAAFLLPLAAVGIRVWYLQAIARERFVVDRDRTETVVEPIPARDGRILSADGLALAYDRTRFDVAVHYRWIEEPPDSRWLREQARLRLAPRERRDRERLAEAEAAIVRERSEFWDAYCRTAGVERSDCDQRRLEIQQRIERMAGSVERRRAERVASTEGSPTEPSAGPWWQVAWKTVVRELTTPPVRQSVDPLVLKEELDYHPLQNDVSFDVAAAIQSAPARFPVKAVTIRMSTQRVYPAADLASHIVGVRRAAVETAETPVDPRANLRSGISGIEQSYDPVLRGRPGLRRVVYNPRREILASDVIREPVDGRDVTLTFDSTIQKAAEQILDQALIGASDPSGETASETADEAPAANAPPQGATLLAMDVQTGRILAAASAPRFDLSLYTDYDDEEWQELLADPRHPFFPRVTALTAPPGSVFKVLTAVAALESGAIAPETVLHCQGYLDRPDQFRCMIFRQHGASHGDLTLSDALCQSCNVYFFQAARTMGPQPIREWAERFGFGAPTGIDIPGEAGGRFPAPSTGGSGKRGATTTTLQLAIGQSSLLVSPLQVVRMMAAVANGGRLVTPHFAEPQHEDSTSSDSPIRLAAHESSIGSRPQPIPELSARTLSALQEGLLRVVADSRGTGKSARVKGASIAGKTGTAETGGGRPDHAWFAGYVPADRPRIAFVVMLEHAGSGGKTAGPVVRSFVEALVDAGVIRAGDAGR